MTDAAHFEDEHGDPSPRAIWTMLFRYARRYRRPLTGLAAFGALTAAFDTVLPWVTGRFIDEVVARGRSASLLRWGLAYFGATLGLAACVGTFIRFAGRIHTHVSHDIRRDGFQSLQRLSFSFFDRRPVGWLMARMTSDCERLANILAWGTLDLAWGVTLMSGYALVMFLTDAGLALLVLASAPVLALVSAFFQKRILRASRLVRKANSRLTAAYNEGIMGVRTAKVFAREREDLAEFRGVSGAMYRASVRNALYSAVYLPMVVTLGSVALGLALAAGGLEVAKGGLTIGTLTMFLLYTRQFFLPCQEMAAWYAEMQMARAAGERILGLIEAVPDVKDSPAVLAALARPHAPGVAPDGHPDRVGRIEFRGVSFAYAGGAKVLEGFDLSVDPGQTVALVGSTGGGKTTIVSLLCRFYEPTEGAILLDGVDYRERSLQWLQSRLGIVLQTPHLFSGTVEENIRYGRLDATDGEVREAARLAGAEAFVLALEKGYGSPVGEGGNRLSTGQKQLVSFARAILARPAILVMDEATSSVDTETERRMQEGLAHLLGGRTSFVIAHRLSTIRAADRILVVEGGRIVEDGDHRTLLRKRGRYRQLYLRQSLREAAYGAADVGAPLENAG